MKKKGGGRKKGAAKADGSAGTPQKKTITSAKQRKSNPPPELSDIEETPINQRKAPPEDIMPSLVPHTRRNTVRSTRNPLPQPPAHVYMPEYTTRITVPNLPPFDDQPLDHTSPHKYPPASFVAAAACAASSPADTLQDDAGEEEGVHLTGTFNDLVGEDTSGLDDLSYSSAEDDEDYDDNMEKTARAIEYSDSIHVRHGRRQTNFIPGGPKPPNYDGMNEVEKVMAKQEYKRERKKFTDGLRLKRLKEQNENFDPEEFSGCLTLGLRTMADVQKCRLEVNHTFPDKEVLVLRVAEEANLRGINFVCTRSDLRDFKCYGPRFCVIARHSERHGWHVSVANVRECDEFGGEYGGVVDVDAGPEKLTSPFRTKWIVPLIMSIIVDSPAISNKNLRHALSAYGKEHSLTDSILQEARTDAKAQLFGSAEENVKYAEGMKAELEKDGHIVKLIYTNRKATLRTVEQLVVGEELLRLKNATNGTLDRDERHQFWSKWKSDNYALLVNQLGYKSQDSTRFLHGVFFTPSFTQKTVPELQTLFTADACHLNFGKYTMFTCYGITANANMSPVGFAIIFGNENGASWKEFWRFIVQTHPSINRANVTIVTDQDKGSMGAIEEILPAVGHFFCAWHRRKNIIKQCGGSSGRIPYSALWVYNKLIECRSVEHFNKLRDRYFPLMDRRDLQYINNIEDTAQYPVKRCEQGAYMYHRQTSQGSEVMNAANSPMRSATAVCPVNAVMLTIKLECRRFTTQQQNAWLLENEFSPRGEKEYSEVFDGVNYRDFTINIVDRGNDAWECTVTRRLVSVVAKHTVLIPKEATNGSYFGQCTCGLATRDAVPCEHMAAIVVSSRIGVLTRNNIMPFWWKRTQWQKQFPREVSAQCSTNMEVIRDDHEADDTIRYCPAWSATNKPGRPAKGKRKLSALEIAQGMKRKPKYLTTFCQICRGFSHRTTDCWLQEKNKEHRPQAWTKDRLAQELIDAAEEAAVEEAMRISADPLPVGAGDDWQGCEGNGEDEGIAD
jgi:hypothetical protein